jgi:hypothetical protein
VLRVLPLMLRLLLERPQLLLRLPVVVVLQVARRLVQRRRVLVRMEGQSLALGGSKWCRMVLAPLQLPMQSPCLLAALGSTPLRRRHPDRLHLLLAQMSVDVIALTIACGGGASKAGPLCPASINAMTCACRALRYMMSKMAMMPYSASPV